MEKKTKIVEELRLERAFENIQNILDYKEEIEKEKTGSITQLTQVIMGGAISMDVSDIHFEPKEEKCRLRVRVDGVLHDVLFLEKEIYERVLSRFKLLAGMKLNITERPQDGRFTVWLGNISMEIRASTLPSNYGENLVLRILNPKSLLSLEELGLRENLLSILKQEIERPNGMIIVTGPTGSGKTTTLYACLRKINKPEFKIITIEDPIEYKLEGIEQTQVDPAAGYDFANGLRAIVRQDPDVILVGEIRDSETAKIAIQAALTGHLVFTTLHTNDAAGTIARLQALGETPSNIAPALNLVIAQRLVRKVCKECVKFETPTQQEIEKIKKAFEKIKIKVPDFEKIPKAVGCKNCNFTGYKGRIGIFEMFLVDDEMEKFILTSPSIVELKEKAIEKGMIPMYQDGLLRVIEGITTIEEVERVAFEI